MGNILIIGAGSMGTAFSFPCSDNNHSVTIIGSHLENEFIDKIESTGIHPALNCKVPKTVKFLKFENQLDNSYLLSRKLFYYQILNHLLLGFSHISSTESR